MFPLLNLKSVKDPILIVAPHPDDEVLSSGGLVQRCVNAGKKIFVLYMTVGDTYTQSVRRILKKPIRPSSYIELGNIRHQEAVKSMAYLGVPKSHLFFLCFPDGYLMKIVNNPSPYAVIQSRTTLLTRASYRFAFQRNAPYSRKKAVALVKSIINQIKPATIIVNHEADTHPDHRATRKLVLDAKRISGNNARLLSYLIHYPGWPQLNGSFLPPVQLQTRKIYKLPITPAEQKKAYKAFRIDRTQFPLSLRIRKLIRTREYFWVN